MNSWAIKSWQEKPCEQSVTYDDPAELNNIINEIQQLPALVTPDEIQKLKKLLALAQDDKTFILQGGDCAETFDECNRDSVVSKLKILLQMSLVLINGMRKPVIRVGRIAGQYAKPRSTVFETKGDITLHSYRGDLINGAEFNQQQRRLNPSRMLQAYNCSASTLDYIRALVDSHTDFFTSHEALHLPYEQALTRCDNKQWYNLSTHYPWVGMRTNQSSGAHIEYLRGISNPVAVKVGPQIDLTDLAKTIELLNPNNEAGKLTLITRLGESRIDEKLPEIINIVKQTGIKVLWSCDPMHGNTRRTNQGIKTRYFRDILKELEASFRIHQKLDNHLAGVHFELTGENVTECVGGAGGLKEEDLMQAYKSLVDPRLNYEQALEMAMLIVQNNLKTP